MKLNNTQHLVTLRAQIEDALKVVAENNGITLKLGNCTYEPDGSKARFTLITLAGKDADETLLALRSSYPEMEGVELPNGKVVCGFKTRSRKFRWVLKHPEKGDKRWITTDAGAGFDILTGTSKYAKEGAKV